MNFNIKKRKEYHLNKIDNEININNEYKLISKDDNNSIKYNSKEKKEKKYFLLLKLKIHVNILEFFLKNFLKKN